VLENDGKKRAEDSVLLGRRITLNSKNQKVDLLQWLFERVEVLTGESILELCCGTGSQTVRLLDLTGEEGRVFAVDVSDEALRQLEDRLTNEQKKRLVTLSASLDDLKYVIPGVGFDSERFDLVFCAYGLYYSTKAQDVLDTVTEYLRPSGRIVVVGPFGPNNGPLFHLLEDAGVRIPPYVRFTSEHFMEEVVIPFACRRFHQSTIHTMVNHVEWKDLEDVLQYWRNTTFFEEHKLESVRAGLEKHFQSNPSFVNEKWVMSLEMALKR
jgi:ubiquinone/menaquinone biosynthesis C-methylase UbiE